MGGTAFPLPQGRPPRSPLPAPPQPGQAGPGPPRRGLRRGGGPAGGLGYLWKMGGLLPDGGKPANALHT